MTHTVEKITVNVNGVQKCVARGWTITDLLVDLDMENQRVAVEMNGHIVPRSAHGETAVMDGANVEIITAVGGG